MISTIEIHRSTLSSSNNSRTKRRQISEKASPPQLELFAGITEEAFEEEVAPTDEEESWTSDSAKASLSTTNSADGSLRRTILWVFLAYGILLRSLPLELRSQV